MMKNWCCWAPTPSLAFGDGDDVDYDHDHDLLLANSNSFSMSFCLDNTFSLTAQANHKYYIYSCMMVVINKLEFYIIYIEKIEC